MFENWFADRLKNREQYLASADVDPQIHVYEYKASSGHLQKSFYPLQLEAI